MIRNLNAIYLFIINLIEIIIFMTNLLRYSFLLKKWNLFSFDEIFIVKISVFFYNIIWIN